MTRSKLRVDERRLTARVALGNARSNTGLLAVLRRFGYDEARLNAGQALYDTERIGCRRVSYATNNGHHWLLSDHLSSTAITIDVNGTQKSELRYKAWGENRASGYAESATPPRFRFTSRHKNVTIWAPYTSRLIVVPGSQPDLTRATTQRIISAVVGARSALRNWALCIFESSLCYESIFVA